MNLIDKIEQPSKVNIPETSITYNPDTCKITKVDGTLMGVGGQMEYIKEYVVEGSFIKYQHRGVEYLTPVHKIDFVATDLDCYKIDYIVPSPYSGGDTESVIKIGYESTIAFFKSGTKVTYKREVRNHPSVLGEFKRLCIVDETLEKVSVQLGETHKSHELLLTEGMAEFTKKINLKTLIDKI